MLDLAPSDTTAISTFSLSEPQVSISAPPPPAQYWFNRAFESLRSASSLLFEQEKLQRELDELANLPDNWNGEGAVRISPRVVARTRSLLASIIVDHPSPELTPNPNGTISLEWDCANRFLHLEIGERDFSILLGQEGHPPQGAQGFGLPGKGLLEPLIAAVTSLVGKRDTSITAENMVA